ncbi:hypothetical protein FRC09_008092, partial [Ceratobasidium sp. 395]
MKRLLVFCDGTTKNGLVSKAAANDFTRAFARSISARLGVTDHSVPSETNVYRLFRCVPSQTTNENGLKIPQIKLYLPGIAAADNFSGDNSHPFEAIKGDATGAYGAHKVAGLINALGLLSNLQQDYFYACWKHVYNEGKALTDDFWRQQAILAAQRGIAHLDATSDLYIQAVSTPPKKVDIKMLGVWDIIGAVRGSGIKFRSDLLGIEDSSIPDCVQCPRHALAYHEDRPFFGCAPFTHDQRLVQVWFPGSHSDVGGGYEEHQIADLSLLWMAGELKAAGVELDTTFLKSRISRATKALYVHCESIVPIGIRSIFWTPTLPAPSSDSRCKMYTETMKESSTYYHR